MILSEFENRGWPKLSRAAISYYRRTRCVSSKYIKELRDSKSIQSGFEKLNIEYKPKARKRNVRASFVYLIKSDDGLIKIGKTSDVSRRLKALNTSSPMNLEVVLSIETADADILERELHRRYESCRVKGEWYSLDRVHIDEISNFDFDSEFLQVLSNG